MSELDNVPHPKEAGNILNCDLPPVLVDNARHSEKEKAFFSEYFQRHFLWQYGGGAEGLYAHRSYFISDFHINGHAVKMDPIVKEIWKQICKVLKLNPYTHIGRCYLLGQTKDMDGPWHRDTGDENSRTLVYYPGFNPHHKHKGTNFRIDGEESETHYMQDHFCWFDARLEHRGLSTTCKESMRVALVFQCVNLENTQNKFIFQNTCGNDERLDDKLSIEIPR